MTYDPVITGQADLESAWRHLLGPLGFSGSSLWFLAVAPDGHLDRRIVQIEDCDEVPAPEQLLALVAGVGTVVDDAVPGARIAFLRSRPGRHGADGDDRAWAAGLYGAARAVGAELEVVHLATDADLVPLPMDAATAA